MKRTYLFILLLFPFLVNAQQKGAAPINTGVTVLGTTRALVIGISSYQDEGIPSLKYAHKDAEEFAKFLQSKAGGALKKEQIEIITNEKATAANIYSKLDWLLEKTKENDRAIIYFSGHGDVETTTSRNRGFLLAYDTPPTNYRIGALRVNDLNDILADIVEVNKGRFVLVADACRSGNLAGGTDGATATASAVSEQYKNQIKIMSCRPNEFSLEGEQWGGGRGAFSFHLIDGLIGMADEDKNAEVDLFELDDYLRSKVSKETDRQQVPMLVGDQKSVLSVVDQAELTALLELRSGDTDAFAAVRSKGREDAILAQTDTIVQQLYDEFMAALDDHYFLPEDFNEKRKQGKSASELYDVLSKVEELLPMHSNMKRNFAVALQDEAQKSINAYLKADPEEMKERWVNFGVKYKSNPAYLSKAASLLGEPHYLHDRLIAKKYYYEGLLLRLEGQKTKSDSLFNLALEKEKQALQFDGDAAFIFNEMGLIYNELYKMEKEKKNNKTRIDDLYNEQVAMFEKASQITPKWVMPYINLTNFYITNGPLEKAEKECVKAYSLDSMQLGSLNCMGYFFDEKKDYQKALNYYQKVIDNNLPAGTGFYNNIGISYFKTDEYDLAEKMYSKALEIDSTDLVAYENLGQLYYMSEQYEKSISINIKRLELDSKNSMPYYNIACLKSIQGKSTEAVEWLKKAIEKGFKNLAWIKEDNDLINARVTNEYKVFEQKYLSGN